MSATTGIEWTDATWNPIRGCSMVSAGCTHCYAQTVAHRFSGPGRPYAGLVQLGADGGSTGKWNGAIRFVEEHLLDPLKWKTPRRIFVNSMSDLFHENVTDEMRDRIFAVMALCPQHTFLVLTKRPERMRAYLQVEDRQDLIAGRGGAFDVDDAIPLERYADRSHFRGADGALQSVFNSWPLPNVWLGVSVEDQKTADARIPLLLQTPAVVRFVSAEPLLGAVGLNYLPGANESRHPLDFADDIRGFDALRARNRRLDWVIAGGESGPRARPMHPDWARSLRDQCKAAGVPFFFKQWGELAPGAQGANFASAKRMYTRIDIHGKPSSDPTAWPASDALFYRVGKKAAGHLLDGVAHREFPAVTSCPR